jgi:hypothetical protein
MMEPDPLLGNFKLLEVVVVPEGQLQRVVERVVRVAQAAAAAEKIIEWVVLVIPHLPLLFKDMLEENQEILQPIELPVAVVAAPVASVGMLDHLLQ